MSIIDMVTARFTNAPCLI